MTTRKAKATATVTTETTADPPTGMTERKTPARKKDNDK